MKQLILLLLLLLTAGWTVLDDQGVPLRDDPFESEEAARKFALDWTVKNGRPATLRKPDETIEPPFRFAAHGSGAVYTWHGGLLVVTGADIIEVQGGAVIDGDPIGETPERLYVPATDASRRIVIDLPVWSPVTVWSAAEDPTQPERELVTWQ